VGLVITGRFLSVTGIPAPVRWPGSTLALTVAAGTFGALAVPRVARHEVTK
jgi:hypothetical protein